MDNAAAIGENINLTLVTVILGLVGFLIYNQMTQNQPAVIEPVVEASSETKPSKASKKKGKKKEAAVAKKDTSKASNVSKADEIESDEAQSQGPESEAESAEEPAVVEKAAAKKKKNKKKKSASGSENANANAEQVAAEKQAAAEKAVKLAEKAAEKAERVKKEAASTKKKEKKEAKKKEAISGANHSEWTTVNDPNQAAEPEMAAQANVKPSKKADNVPNQKSSKGAGHQNQNQSQNQTQKSAGAPKQKDDMSWAKGMPDELRDLILEKNAQYTPKKGETQNEDNTNSKNVADWTQIEEPVESSNRFSNQKVGGGQNFDSAGLTNVDERPARAERIKIYTKANIWTKMHDSKEGKTVTVSLTGGILDYSW